MPLKLTRRVARQNSDSVLQLAVSLTALSKDLATMSCFPPATALVGVLLLIMETVQEVQTNQEECNRLARRCATILLNINDQMSGRWDRAPQSLVKNLGRFQETLDSIHNFMKQAASTKWMSRFIKRTSIQNTLAQYHEELNDAAQSFQISTLIEIHYAMDPRTQRTSEAVRPESDLRAVLPHRSEAESVPVRVPAIRSPIAFEAGADDFILSPDVLKDHGFRRYHQSEVVLRGGPRTQDPWWSGASEAHANGQSSLVKRYEGPPTVARKQWIRDIKVLQRLYHPNLPQMLGYSQDSVPTPFILLSNVQLRSPESFLTGSLRRRGVASCIQDMLRFYSDIVDAMFYVQQQMSFSDQEAQDFLENSALRIDASNRVIVGLPASNPGTVTFRSYLLNESLRTTVLRMLPNRGLVGYKQDHILDEDTWKLTQLTALVASLLPSGSEPPGLSPQLRQTVGTADESYGTQNLRQLRLLGLEGNSHGYVWNKNSSIPPHKFTVGDIGYIPAGRDWDSFLTLGNILTEGLASFDLQRKSSGSQWCWKDRPIRQVEMQSFDLPHNIQCWPVAVPPGAQIDCQINYRTTLTRIEDAWRFLLDNAVALGNKYNAPPASLILITQVGTDQSFHINDFGGGLQMQLPPRGIFPRHSTLPRVMYLLTSDRSDYESCWSHSPVAISPPAPLDRGWTYRVAWKTGCINWAQLHPEDFEGLGLAPTGQSVFQ
ncbi:hypothetical protein B0H15DRAFT_869336 [Mycena belliarum]|uniref:Mixed lineage kinase domain-containing protein n=1 Tax=Mycena belliarum TaxID=1033014 RepID=A0AAD6TPH4_9AGAR|nr:hypothetical protein B0H15DRAFT_869336 [Mycena belliae]